MLNLNLRKRGSDEKVLDISQVYFLFCQFALEKVENITPYRRSRFEKYIQDYKEKNISLK